MALFARITTGASDEYGSSRSPAVSYQQWWARRVSAALYVPLPGVLGGMRWAECCKLLQSVAGHEIEGAGPPSLLQLVNKLLQFVATLSPVALPAPFHSE